MESLKFGISEGDMCLIHSEAILASLQLCVSSNQVPPDQNLASQLSTVGSLHGEVVKKETWM